MIKTALGWHIALLSLPFFALATVNPYHNTWQCAPVKGEWQCRVATYSDTALYSADLSRTQRQTNLARALGWTPDQGTCTICEGHYTEPILANPNNLSLSASPSVVHGGPIRYQVNGDLVFTKGMYIEQPGRTLYADYATLSPDPQTKKLRAITASGNVRLHQPGQVLLGNHLQADLTNHQAELDQASYLIRVSPTSPRATPNKPSDPNFTGYAQGQATTAKELNQNQYVLTHATYSTCAPVDPSWSLFAARIDLDEATGFGQAYNMLFRIHDVPIFYLPYFNFPINSERKSGFLYSNITSNSDSGLSLSLPYYFNLAPNYDDTFIPVIFSKRGLLFDNNFRYLTTTSSGNIDIGLVPYDLSTNQTRYSYTVNNTTTLPDNWQGTLNYNYVSDDNYLTDFGSEFNILAGDQSLLNRSFTLNHTGTHWNFGGLLQGYQIIDNDVFTNNEPYNELPSLTLTGQYPNFFGPLGFSLLSNVTNFTKTPGSDDTIPIEGVRAYVQPALSLPLTQSYGYITPTLSLNAASYSLTNTVINGFPNGQVNRVLPIFDIDSRLYLDRTFTLLGNTYTQTLSPRLYYLFVPYANQNNIPVFDTSINTFNYSQLFTNNRFSGEDRIGDANQLSYALESSINNAAGAQVIDGGIGQIMYFRNRDVSLCVNPQGASVPCVNTEDPYYKENFSDIAGFFTYHFNPQWSFNTNITYNPTIQLLDYQDYELQYMPDSTHLFNIGYNNNRLNYSSLSTQQLLAGTAAYHTSELTTSFVWDITPQWALLGDFNLSLQSGNGGPISEFGGIQYNACCYAVRLVAYRYLSDIDPNNPGLYTGPMSTTILFQFLLKGLGTFGNNQVASLLAGIPGYQNQLGF